jgi:2-dehydropantoate 2-reductase
MIETSVLVVGAGAIGGLTAARLTGEVDRVAVLDANEEHVERMRGDGLLLDDLGAERRVRLEAHAGPAGLDGPFDFALITLKAPTWRAPWGRCSTSGWWTPSSPWATASCRSGWPASLGRGA